MNDTAPRPALPAVQVRNSRDDDLPGIQAIYAHHVLHGTGTFEIDPPSLEDMTRRRADVLGNRFPWLVAERDGVLLGYAYANHFRTRPAYRFTVEDSIYIAPQAVGQGVGRLLMTALLGACEARGCRQVLAVIGDSGNTASIALHAAAGFRMTGTLVAVGWKFGRWLDVVMMQYECGEGARSAPP
ncbi:MAG: GNAT family N-acetyltransferase [Burkholderiales bacterium]|nr:GNAT family N-acetyltransferase [Burkholderiales bacterium]